MSGASCSLSVCWSAKVDFEWMMRYGSIGHSFFEPLGPGASQKRGKPLSEPPPTPPIPLAGKIIFGERHARHCRCSLVARDERTEAEMTIPGIRTSLFMVLAVRSRNCSMLRPDRSVTWILGIASSAAALRSSELAKG